MPENKQKPPEDFDLILIEESRFCLDGGSMFGIVPKVLWHKLMPADEQNRIELAVNCLLIIGEKKILVDTGIGDSLKPRYHEIYQLKRGRSLIEQLADRGLAAADIDYVINTHLHFDHAGGNVIREGGRVKPAFPNAQYVIQRSEWEDATHPNERSRASYMNDDFTVLEKTGQLRFIDGDCQLLPGLEIMHTGGHCTGHQSVAIELPGGKAVFLGDIIPTAAHLKSTYMTAFDVNPRELMNIKKRIIKQAIKGKWLLIFEHDTNTPMAYLEEKDGKYVLKPIDSVNSKLQIPNTCQRMNH